MKKQSLEIALLQHNSIVDCCVIHRSDPPAGVTAYVVFQGGLGIQALTDHLRELRSCLIKSFLVIMVGFAGSYAFIKPIGTWFFMPLIDVLPADS